MNAMMRKLAVGCALASTVALTGCFLETPYLERDVRDDVFYFVMPDRFENGDLSNDMGGLGGDKMIHGFDLFDKGMYHGGDMAGLESRLDYLKDLGITAIWMTPILKNQAMQGDSAAYHGYWTLDFTQIDPHLGSNDDLQSLIDAAHDRNMKVYFDIITNHTADVIKYEECHNADGTSNGEPCSYVSLAEKAAGNGLTPFIPEGMENVKVPAWLNDTQYYNNQGDSTFSGENSEYGDFSGLDDLDTHQPEVVTGMIDIFKNIVSEFKPDGFRIDTVKHVNIEFWQEFSPAIIEHAKSEGIPNFFMFGEVYDGNPQYLSQFTTVGKLPSVLDFGIQGAASSVFAGNGSSQALATLFAQDDVYSDADSDASLLMNFGGNHDMGRIGMFIQNSQPNATDDEKLARAKLFNAFMFFARGIPVIYYGDEQGFTGDGGDKDAREDMFPSLVDEYNDNNLIGSAASIADDNFDPTHPLFVAISEYADIYKQHEGLRYGEHINRYSETDGGLYAFSRVDESQREYMVVFNSEASSRSLTLEASAAKYFPIVGEDTLKRDNAGNITIDVAPFDFVIYQASQAAKWSPKSEFTIEGVGDGSAVAGRVDIALELMEPLTILPTYEATFEVSLNNGSSFELLATDRTAPYQLFWHTDDLADGTNVIVRATLENGRSKATQQQVSLVIDSRVPESVVVDYENGNQRDYLYVADQNGGLQGPIRAINNSFSFSWNEDSDSQLLYFVDKTDDTFAIDKPVQIGRSTIVALSSENAEGGLDASLFINNSGKVDNQDNDTGLSAVELPLAPMAPAPYGEDINVRGGLNGWSADAMTYVGNQTYKLTRVVDQGDVEFKYADSNWSPVNIGGQVTANGLVLGSNPGNLTHNFPETALYSFYLISTELDGQPVILHFIDQELGPVGETLYVKGDMNGWSSTDALTYMGDNSYTTTLPLAAGSYNFKLANDDWSWERVIVDGQVDLDVAEPVIASGANINLSAVESANYSFNYVYDESLTVSSDFVSEVEPGFKVYFKKPDSWSTVNVYFWEAATTPSPEWPGIAMTDLGEGWYSYEFSEGTTAANIIFNDGSGTQTENLYREGDGCYDIASNTWTESCDLPQVQLTLYFEQPAGWAESINIYHWNSAPAPAVAWPGVGMTSLGDGWFSYTFEEGVAAANLIFNDGAGNQTADLFRDADGCFNIDNGWVAQCTHP
ncbi:alpha-amylase family glycosyl hydrolase [Reinekea sp.]|jgi:glycosidase|uniref:alpha-amylase family glycosyl hydrolase n=1 Tax=Reinekea sp. TaxID=1970455 RepID=UPI003989DEEF